MCRNSSLADVSRLAIEGKWSMDESIIYSITNLGGHERFWRLIEKVWVSEQSFLMMDHYANCSQESLQSQGHCMDSLGMRLLCPVFLHVNSNDPM